MIDLNKYSEKEVVAAILAVEEIVNDEDFSLDIVEEDGEVSFCLIDQQGVYLGDIGFDRFANIGSVIDRMSIYHNDYFYNDYLDRAKDGDSIPQNDWARKVLIFLESKYCQDLISNIDIETYKTFTEKYLSQEENKTYTDFLKLLNDGEKEKYVSDDIAFDFVAYLCDKSIAIALMDTQEAYPMVEYDNRIFVAAHGDWYANKEEMLKDLRTGEESFCNSFTNYGTLIETERYQVLDDMRDIGLFDDKDNWSFYLTEYELEYIGLGEEKNKLLEEYNDIIFLSENDVSDEFMEQQLASIVEDARARSEALDTNKDKNIDLEKE